MDLTIHSIEAVMKSALLHPLLPCCRPPLYGVSLRGVGSEGKGRERKKDTGLFPRDTAKTKKISCDCTLKMKITPSCRFQRSHFLHTTLPQRYTF